MEKKDKLDTDILKALACLNTKSVRAYVDDEQHNVLHIPQHNISVTTNSKGILFKRGAADLYNTGKLPNLKCVKIDPKVVTYLKLYNIVVNYEATIMSQLNNIITQETLTYTSNNND